MPVEVIMPKVDMDMASGTLAAWHVAEGEAVAKGAPLFDIETDKAAMEVESPATGRLRHVIAGPGQTVDVGAPVAWIYAEGEPVGLDPAAAAAPAADASAGDTTPVTAAPEPRTGLAPERRAVTAGVRATPVARRLARAASLDLGSVTGTGPQGRIQREDVEARLAVSAPPAEARAPDREAPAPAVARADGAGDLFVSIRKGTGTPLALIHGFAADSAGWLPLERELPPDLPLIRIDLPGHGKSPRPRIEDFAALVRTALAAFDRSVAGEVHLLGHSLGGAVALALADARPRSVASLTLIAPAGLGPEIDYAALHGIARASRAESLGPWMKRLTAKPDALGWDFVRAAMLARTDAALRSAQVELAEALFPDGVQGFDLTAALDRVVAPSAMIWGRCDRILPWRHALTARGETALHLLRETGHIPHVERPGIVAGVLARLMEQAGRR